MRCITKNPRKSNLAYIPCTLVFVISNKTIMKELIEKQREELEKLWTIGSIGEQSRFGRFSTAKDIQREFYLHSLKTILTALIEEEEEKEKKGISPKGAFLEHRNEYNIPFNDSKTQTINRLKDIISNLK